MTTRSVLWRLCFFLVGAFILVGGPRHPGGTMAEMLAHPDWVPSHTLILVGFVALLFGVLLWRRAVPLPAGSERWARFAVYGAILQIVEMAFHTASKVDHAHLVAGQSTPILTTHLWLAVLLYPLFGVAMIGWILATARERTLGSPWIAWLGILGAAAHGASAPLYVGLRIEAARILFPMLLFFALWCILAALWPVKPRSESAPLVTG